MRTADFDFQLPIELIAQTPAIERDQSRLLVLRRDSGQSAHRRFPDLLEYLRPGDVLALNNSRVIPARLRGVNMATGGRFEILLLEENAANDWWAMLRPGKRARAGTQIRITTNRADEARSKIRNPKSKIQNLPKSQIVSREITATVMDTNHEGHRRLFFTGTPNVSERLDALGEVPLPPYIRRNPSVPDGHCNDLDRYQTVFAQPGGSVAAPTAGLHFTEPMLERARSLGVHVCFVTLHVGLGTFAPVKSETLAAHKMHEERYELSEETALVINRAKQAGRRIIAVGTTTVRVLESAARFGVPPSGGPATRDSGPAEGGTPNVAPGSGRTRIFIHPPHEFKIADALLTNFHLPRSTLLMLTSAFAAPNQTRGREMVLSAYAEAIRERYRFFSYGDAMLLL